MLWMDMGAPSPIGTCPSIILRVDLRVWFSMRQWQRLAGICQAANAVVAEGMSIANRRRSRHPYHSSPFPQLSILNSQFSIFNSQLAPPLNLFSAAKEDLYQSNGKARRPSLNA